MKKKVNFKLIFFIILISMFNLKSLFANYDKVFFDFKLKSISGDEINLSDYKGKTVLLVNVASRCGCTKQYDDLQKIWDNYKNKGLVVIGIPSNNFKQEPASNKEIKEFCETNFSINLLRIKLIDSYIYDRLLSIKITKICLTYLCSFNSVICAE